MDKAESMVTGITSAMGNFTADLTTVATTVLPIGAAALLVWIGWRLACKIPNRGVGR